MLPAKILLLAKASSPRLNEPALLSWKSSKPEEVSSCSCLMQVRFFGVDFVTLPLATSANSQLSISKKV